MARADAAVKVRSLVILWSRWGFCCLILFILAIAIAESSRSARQNAKMEYVGGNVLNRDEGRTWEG